jgi:hypothetical protein
MFRPLLAGLAACFLMLPASAMAETRTFTATADAPAASAWPSVNYGTNSRLLVNVQGTSSATRESYVRFNVSLPEGATVTGARVRLYATALQSSGTSLWRAGNAWTETGLSWSNRPAATSGELYRDLGTTLGWREFPAGAVGSGPQTFLLRGHGTSLSQYHSREDANDPQLVVTYTVDGVDEPPSTEPPPPPATGCPVPRPQTTWRAPGSAPLSDAQAAACVTRSGENRPQNANQNAKAPTPGELDAFRTARDSSGSTPAQYNRNFAHVTGGGAAYGLRSTDDVIEWAAYKWGIPEDFVRGQMVMESGWSMLQKGDRRDWTSTVSSLYPTLAVIDADSVWESLGIAQIRWRHTVPWNPGVEPLRWQSTGFALDYSQALIRYYYDGLCNWCGSGYVAGDADGAYRTYVSGSWSEGQWYADGVRSNAASKPWLPIPPP